MALTKVSFSMINGAAVSVGDYIPAGTVTSTTDCSVFFNAAFNDLIAQGGGTLSIPFGTYKVALDWSAQIIAGDYSEITIQGNNAILLGVTGEVQILRINNPLSGDNSIYTRITFNDLEFRTESNVCNGGTPVIPYAVQLLNCAAEFNSCEFKGGSIAAYHGTNAQYAKFVDCSFLCATITPAGSNPSAGCWIESTSATLNTISDQMYFELCTFGVCQNGLVILGCQSLRVLNCRFQGMFGAGRAALVIDNYVGGVGGSENIHISRCHFEGNEVRDIQFVTPSSTSRILIESCIFPTPLAAYPTRVASIQSYSTFQTLISNDFRTGSGPELYVTGSLGTLVYLGNDKAPAVLDTSGATNPQLLVQDPAAGTTDFGFSKLKISAFWPAPGLDMGGYILWVDSSGRLRIKNGAPTSDTDGVVVGTQT